MEKRKLLLSFFGFISALFITIFVAYAWFTLIIENDVKFPNINIESPEIEFYELHFFTYDRVYKYNSTTKSLLMYNDSTSNWVIPNYNDTEEQDKNFNGIIMNQFDPLITENNYCNNIIIEIYLHYHVENNTSNQFSIASNPMLASKAILEFKPTQAYFLSHFVYIQNMKFEKIERTDDENIFETVTNVFENPTYPTRSFYDENDLYTTEIPLGNIDFITSKSDAYLYINLSYNQNKIREEFNNIWGEDLSFKQPFYFFQDITFLIKKNEG